MKFARLFILFLFTTSAVFSQNKQISIRDAIIGQTTYLSPNRPKELKWRDNTHYVRLINDTLFQFSAINNKKEVLLDLKDLQITSWKLKNIYVQAFPSFKFISKNWIRFEIYQKLIVFDLKEKKVVRNYSIPGNAKNLDFCNANLNVAYTKGQNLFILNGNGETQITFDTDKGVVNGQYVHRREFGITKGIFWSPKGNFVAFYRKDESMVKDYPLVNYMVREAEYTPIKYPMAGMTSHQVTLGVYDLQSRKTTFMDTGKPDDHYLTNISWGPAEKYIYIAELNRGQNDMHMNQYDVFSGKKMKTLFEKTRKTYVEPLHPIVFTEKDPYHFYYWSRTNGWFHLYLYDTNGKQIKQITTGNWEVTDFYGSDGKNIYIQSTKESPIERHLYRVNLSNGKLTRLDRTPGTHEASFSPDKKYLIDQWTAAQVPGQTDLTASTGKLIRNIDTATNPAADYQFGKNEIVKIKAADGTTDLYGRLILPPNLNPSKKYPVIIYVYGGPHAQIINDTWHNDVRWWQYYMASKGYILFTLDNRGSENRGQAFEEVIFRHLGVNETADQMKGVEYLKSLPYVDADRIGVHGWSFGGFMTLNLMLRHPETFKVGVAGGPVVDWSMYEVMYGERYMDTPQENPEGYAESNMVNHVKDLKGKLMLIHGAQDSTVVMQHSMKFLRECVKENKQVDFFSYPTHPHNVRGTDRVHLMNKVSHYFFDYL